MTSPLTMPRRYAGPLALLLCVVAVAAAPRRLGAQSNGCPVARDPDGTCRVGAVYHPGPGVDYDATSDVINATSCDAGRMCTRVYREVKTFFITVGADGTIKTYPRTIAFAVSHLDPGGSCTKVKSVTVSTGMNGADAEIGRRTLAGSGLCNFSFADMPFRLELFSVQEIQSCPAQPLRKSLRFALFDGSNPVKSQAPFGDMYEAGYTYVDGVITCEGKAPPNQNSNVPVHSPVVVDSVTAVPVAVRAFCPAIVTLSGSFVANKFGAGTAYWTVTGDPLTIMAPGSQFSAGRQTVSATTRVTTSRSTTLTLSASPAGGPGLTSRPVPFVVTCDTPPIRGRLPDGSPRLPPFPVGRP